MKKTFIKSKPTFLMVLILCFVMIFPLFTFTGCGSLTYGVGADGSAISTTIIEGKVGEDYMAFVGTAKTENPDDVIAYALKEGSVLPAGLVMDADGFIEGIPTEKGDFAFSVIATLGEKSAEASFNVKIQEGALAYESQEVKVVTGADFEKSVAIATTESGSVINGVTYALAEDSDPLPEGVNLSSDGILSGTVASNGEHNLKITASAKDCAPVTADVLLKAAKPWLVYDTGALPKATAGTFYTANVATAVSAVDSTAVPNVVYTLPAGSKLPAGLSLSREGLISGTPTEATNATFSIRAGVTGYTAATAEFKIKVNASFPSVAEEGTLTLKTESFADVETSKYVYVPNAVEASTTNRQTTTFFVTEGELPKGLSLYENGALVGKTTDVGQFNFTITAKADGCEDVSKEYSIKVVATLVYENEKYYEDSANDLFVGQQCNLDLGKASKPAGYESDTSAIKYEFVSAPDGLVIDPDTGVVTGAPTKSYKQVAIEVMASAEGFSSKKATFTVHIEDAVVSGVTRFEAEYIDLRGMVGSGYSGSAQEGGLIDSTPEVKASRSKNGKDCETVAGGYYLPYTYGPMLLTFEFESDRAVTGADISAFLDSEVAASFSIEPNEFAVRVNGIDVAYGSIAIDNSTGKLIEFKKYAFGKVNLVEGANVVEIQLYSNSNNVGGSYNPAIDAIEFENLGGATLSWRPALYNLAAYTQA